MAFGSPSLESGRPAPAPGSKRRPSIGLLAVGGVLLFIAVVVFFWSNGYVQACQSFLGRGGQVFSDDLRKACTLMKLVWYGAILALGVSGAVVVLGAITWMQRR
jgi:hypothetical protein